MIFSILKQMPNNKMPSISLKVKPPKTSILCWIVPQLKTWKKYCHKKDSYSIKMSFCPELERQLRNYSTILEKKIMPTNIYQNTTQDSIKIQTKMWTKNSYVLKKKTMYSLGKLTRIIKSMELEQAYSTVVFVTKVCTKMIKWLESVYL